MPEKDAETYRINPFDVTKVWSHRDYPRIEVGEIVLNRNPENYFSDVEQAAFAPSAVVPGLGFSPDRMLQGRLFSYADAQRYRLGVNYHQVQVNRPVVETLHYHRDGAIRVDGNGGGVHRHNHRADEDYYTQAGDLYRLMKPEQKKLLIDNIVEAVKSVPAFIQERQLAHFMKADPSYGEGIKKGLATAHPGDPRKVSVTK